MKSLNLKSVLLACVLVLAACSSGARQPGASGNGRDEALLPEAPPPGEVITWQARPDRNWVFSNSNDDCFLYLKLNSGGGGQNNRRVPLNIALVLDRSGSMSGAKLAYAKKAAKFVVDQLGSEDYLSIVDYDDAVEVLSASQPVRNRDLLKQKIEALTDRGSTNMTGGMMEGYRQVRSNQREGYVNRVLLLTDGLANVGITEPGQIKRLVEKKYREEGIALSTFGLGADYNEDLLTMMAETGHANYYFIDKAEKIPQLFAGELKGLLNVVAQNVNLEVAVPEGWSCDRVYGYPYELRDGKVQIRLNDVYAHDEKGILLRFRPGRSIVRAVQFYCSLSYTDAADFEEVKSRKTVSVGISNSREQVAQSRDKGVEAQIAVFETTERFDEILADADRGDYESARRKAGAAVQYVKDQQAVAPSPALQKQEEQLNSYYKSVEMMSNGNMSAEEKSMLQKSNKSSNYIMKKGSR